MEAARTETNATVALVTEAIKMEAKVTAVTTTEAPEEVAVASPSRNRQLLLPEWFVRWAAWLSPDLDVPLIVLVTLSRKRKRKTRF